LIKKDIFAPTKNMIRKLLIFCFLVSATVSVQAVQTRFTMSAPNAVEMGKQFRLSFTLNERGSNLKLPPGIENNFDILMGPSTSQSFSSMTSINVDKQHRKQLTDILIYFAQSRRELLNFARHQSKLVEKYLNRIP
jgi:hypothetical protein